MSIAHAADPTTSDVAELTIHRQPVVLPDRSVYGYALRISGHDRNGGTLPEHQVEHLVDLEFAYLDLPALAGDAPVFLRATTHLLTGDVPLPDAPHGLVLEVPPAIAAREDAVPLLEHARAMGVRLALADYSGTSAQDGLLPSVDFVKVDAAHGPDRLAELVHRAHDAGVTVVAERADSRERVTAAVEAGADLLQGPMFQREPAPEPRDFTPGQLQCLVLVRLLSAEPVDQNGVVQTVAADPELAMRVLHLVNSSAFALRREIDSVHQAVVLVGPKRLLGLATAAMVDASPTTTGALWAILTRAITCRSLASDDVAYTVGLLSAVASQLEISVADLIARTGVSRDVGAALRNQSGPYGPVLSAVLAHEENDLEGVRATGLEPFDVAHVYLAAVAEALGKATSLAVGAA
jgi:c-di-GMP-related signal transduction protein